MRLTVLALLGVILQVGYRVWDCGLATLQHLWQKESLVPGWANGLRVLELVRALGLNDCPVPAETHKLRPLRHPRRAQAQALLGLHCGCSAQM